MVNIEDSVAPAAYRGRSIGPAALLAVFDVLQAQGVRSVVTRIAVDNTPSRRAAGKTGFVQVAIVELHKRGRRLRRTVTPEPGQERSWLVQAFSG